MNYTDEQLEKIGQAVASEWGAYCLRFKRFKNKVKFYCIEYDEKFYTELTYKEIADGYACYIN